MNFLSDKSMSQAHNQATDGAVRPTNFTGTQVTMNVDIRRNLSGNAMRQTVATKETMRRLRTLAESYNPDSRKWSASLDLTVRLFEIHGWRLQNTMSNQFNSASQIAQHVEQNYNNLNRRFIPPEHVE